MISYLSNDEIFKNYDLKNSYDSYDENHKVGYIFGYLYDDNVKMKTKFNDDMTMFEIMQMTKIMKDLGFIEVCF